MKKNSFYSLRRAATANFIGTGQCLSLQRQRYNIFPNQQNVSERKLQQHKYFLQNPFVTSEKYRALATSMKMYRQPRRDITVAMYGDGLKAIDCW